MKERLKNYIKKGLYIVIVPLVFFGGILFCIGFSTILVNPLISIICIGSGAFMVGIAMLIDELREKLI